MSDIEDDIQSLLEDFSRGDLNEKVTITSIIQLMGVMAKELVETYLKVQGIEVYGFGKSVEQMEEEYIKDNKI